MLQQQTQRSAPDVTYSLKLVRDTTPPNPRIDYDCLGVMVCSHPRYNLGDEDGFNKAVALVRQHYSESVLDEYDLNDPPTVLKLIIQSDAAIVLPLYLFDHSGITMKTTPFSCPWDSGQVGYIFLTKEKARKEYGWKRLTKERIEKLESYLRAEVKEYDQYLIGDAWVFHTYKNGEPMDSCGGFWGEDPTQNGMLEHLDEPYVALVMSGSYDLEF